MKKVTVILISALVVFLMGCEKEQLMISQQDGPQAVEWRKDSKSTIHRPEWAFTVNQINASIDELTSDGTLDTWNSHQMRKRMHLISRKIQENQLGKARKMVRVFLGEIETMMEEGDIPPVVANTLTPLMKQLHQQLL